MGKSRKAKPEGLIPFYLPSLTPGPLGHNDAGYPNRPHWLVGDRPGSLGAKDHDGPGLRLSFDSSPQASQLRLDPQLESAYWLVNPFSLSNVVLMTEADVAEFNLLRGKITDQNVAEYVKHRTEFFGSTAAYEEFAAESDKELDETQGLSKRIEMTGEAKKVFYRWVRQAYLNKQVKDVPRLILQGQSEELIKALSKVQASFSKDFKHGGFNPRPKKDSKYRYRLGTISEHAMGMAVDIESNKNPILSTGDWKFIEKLTEQTVDRSASRWERKPKELWQEVKNLNDLFVAKVKAEVKRIEDEREAEKQKESEGKPKESGNKHGGKEKKLPAAVEEVLKGHPDLKKWTGGFFTLEWELVEQLHIHGFLWGVTFSNAVDLHHFELKSER